MLSLQRHHRGAELDARGVRGHQRHHGQRVEVVGHLRHPRGVQTRRFGPLDIGHQLRHLARHVAALGPDHHTKPHAGSPAFSVERAHVADQRVQRRAGREHRRRTDGQQLLHIGLGDGAADHHGDVARVGGAQRLDGARGQRDVRTREDAQPDQCDVLLQRDRHDVLDALADPGVDDLEPGVTQRAGDDLGAAVMAVKTGLRDEHSSGH